MPLFEVLKVTLGRRRPAAAGLERHVRSHADPGLDAALRCVERCAGYQRPSLGGKIVDRDLGRSSAYVLNAHDAGVLKAHPRKSVLDRSLVLDSRGRLLAGIERKIRHHLLQDLAVRRHQRAQVV